MVEDPDMGLLKAAKVESGQRPNGQSSDSASTDLREPCIRRSAVEDPDMGLLKAAKVESGQRPNGQTSDSSSADLRRHVFIGQLQQSRHQTCLDTGLLIVQKRKSSPVSTVIDKGVQVLKGALESGNL